MFENALVDRFSRTPWFVVPALYFPIITAFLWYGYQADLGVSRAIGCFAGGWLAWTLAEYWLHRTLFHWRPPTKWGDRMHFILHGVHHDFPRDRYRLVFPPALSVTLVVPLLFLSLSLFGEAGWYVMAGFALGYVVYDTLHYFVHHARPRGRVLKALRKHHLAHHSPRKGGDCKYGVSTTLWDHVFRTYG